MFQLFLSETVDYLSNSAKKWNVFTRNIKTLVKPSRYYIFIASLLYFFHVSAFCFNVALNLSIKENVLQYVKILFIIFPWQIRSERLNSLCHLLTENFPYCLTISMYLKQLFAHLPVRLSKNKKLLTMMWTIYISRKVKYQNFLDQMNMGSKEWRSGESARLPPMWPGFKSQRQRHMWDEFVIGSLLCSKRFFPLSSKTNISKFQFDQESGRRRTTLWMCYLQIIIYLFILFIYLHRGIQFPGFLSLANEREGGRRRGGGGDRVL